MYIHIYAYVYLYIRICIDRYAYIRTCIYTYIFICICILTFYKCKYIYIHIHKYIYTYIYTYIYLYMYRYMCIHIYTCLCTYVYICINVRTRVDKCKYCMYLLGFADAAHNAIVHLVGLANWQLEFTSVSRNTCLLANLHLWDAV